VTFKDHFSGRAALYAAYRPSYPPALFHFLAGVTEQHRLAVDIGTGSGQAAAGLANHFERVIGIDPSAEQLHYAARHPNVEYRIARAESTGLAAGCADLVAVAQALHWLDTDSFFREAKRVLVPDGVVAVWGYGDPVLDSGPLDRNLHEFNRVLLEPYWFAERRLLLTGYRTITFPFDELPVPHFELQAQWTLAELLGYLRTWSATANYIEARGSDPVIDLEKLLARDWGKPEGRRVVRWPLHLRAGRKRA
jgi:SAM-dependent methyltransferase